MEENEMSKIIETNEQLVNTVASVAAEHGYKDVKAEFVAFSDFKVKWQRTFEWITFQVSDFMKDAPEEVITNIFEVIFSKMRGDDVDYNEEAIAYMTGDGFVERNQRTWFERHRAGAKVEFELWDELKAEGLILSDERPAVRVGDVYYTSMLLRAMIVPEKVILDRELMMAAFIIMDGVLCTKFPDKPKAPEDRLEKALGEKWEEIVETLENLRRW